MGRHSSNLLASFTISSFSFSTLTDFVTVKKAEKVLGLCCSASFTAIKTTPYSLSRAGCCCKWFISSENLVSVICRLLPATFWHSQKLPSMEILHPDGLSDNVSQKHESIFTSLTIRENKSVMLSSLAGCTLGVWVSHGEGRFSLPQTENKYQIVSKYAYETYPACPNGSDYNTAMICDETGRHLVMMPHIERSLLQWQWAHYPKDRQKLQKYKSRKSGRTKIFAFLYSYDFVSFHASP